jgi:two-component system response regulator HydG
MQDLHKMTRKPLSINQESANSQDEFWKPGWVNIIQTKNSNMRRVFEKIRSVSSTIASVLLLGETGTGKGLMAKLIHQHSHRCNGPFVSVHCGAIPDTLIESELFGHEKGAFTGADRRKTGKFEMAGDGTMFLDEIGTITSATQIKLLQVLQDGTFSRVGGTEQLHTNARIIAATNADLQRMVESGAFRGDLYYRLNVFPIELPPLRDRKEDIPNLLNQFIVNLNRKYGKDINRLQKGLSETLSEYPWPGNLRELENILERAYIIESGDALSPESFPETMMMSSRIAQSIGNPGTLTLAEARQIAVDEFERTYLIQLLIKHSGKVNPSAKEAGISTRQLSRLISRYDLDKKSFKC